MPFRSEKQRRWMHATHPEMAKRWEAESRGRNPLREQAKKRHTKKGRTRHD